MDYIFGMKSFNSQDYFTDVKSGFFFSKKNRFLFVEKQISSNPNKNKSNIYSIMRYKFFYDWNEKYIGIRKGLFIWVIILRSVRTLSFEVF